MANDFDLKRTLEQLQRDIQRETGELHTKQAAVATIAEEKTRLEKQKQIDIAEKNRMEVELPKLVRKINDTSKKISDIDREKPKLDNEIRIKTADLNKKGQELQKNQESLKNALAKK